MYFLVCDLAERDEKTVEVAVSRFQAAPSCTICNNFMLSMPQQFIIIIIIIIIIVRVLVVRLYTMNTGAFHKSNGKTVKRKLAGIKS